MTSRPHFKNILLHAAWLCSTLPFAYADGGTAMPRQIHPAYQQECAACHLAYPPGMLPASSWKRMMSGLDKHYGTDASLDAAKVQQLSNWLQSHAGTYKRVAEEPPQDRISKSAWFERKHRAIAPQVWALASVKSASNCAACHTGANKGMFDDDNLQYPAGLSTSQRRAWQD